MSIEPHDALIPWRREGWCGVVRAGSEDALADLLQLEAPGRAVRRSRHAETFVTSALGGRLWVKRYRDEGARFARRAQAMHGALRAAGFGAPSVVLAGWSGRHGILVTAQAPGAGIMEAIGRIGRGEKRALLDALGVEVARLHRAGFVPGDLVPSNVLADGRTLVFLDHDRTRRSRALVWWHGRRNLVQLGRFVVPELTVTDRARVLRAYARERGWGRRRRRRLARWLVGKITARRRRFDGIDDEKANAVGFRELMRAGGPWDPGRRSDG